MKSIAEIRELVEVAQGFMNDCISRQAAIDALAKFVPFAICDESTESYTNGLTDAYYLILKLPSAQPELRWIPCSERLPEIKQHVLLSCYGRVIYGRMISKDGNGGYPVFEICDSVGEKRPIVLETTVHSEFTTSRIIAWMPLPEPYKTESDAGR